MWDGFFKDKIEYLRTIQKSWKYFQSGNKRFKNLSFIPINISEIFEIPSSIVSKTIKISKKSLPRKERFQRVSENSPFSMTGRGGNKDLIAVQAWPEAEFSGDCAVHAIRGRRPLRAARLMANGLRADASYASALLATSHNKSGLAINRAAKC